YPPVASFLFSLLLRSPRSSLFPTRRSSDLIAVHAVWLDDEEVALMGARDAALAYCPSSNMFLGDGVTRLPELLRAGVRAGLGTRSEEHTSELQSLTNLVCRLLLEKQKRY